MQQTDWNPDLYLKFNKERTQPSIDLVSRIAHPNPQTIIDIGCGPGNSTQILVERWPHAQVAGADSSPAMIEKAKGDFPQQQWFHLDAGKDDLGSSYDIIFSNAVIQWIPDQPALFRKFHHALNDEGVIALQLPLFWDMPLGKAIKEVAKDERWSAVTQAATDLFTLHPYSFYYDQLSALFSSVEMWETHYMHVMDSHQAVITMMQSTGLKPYMERLSSEADKREFEERVLARIKEAYPQQKDGKVLLPFDRLFFIARK